ncbi:SIS domain-containing protein [Enterococcus malodoratus]|uniref:SIS domain-containing protein n=1 Tax=Enterococcus malodoratus TaxID=71451 RepID=UPI0008BFAA2A|nr:SIS domain-containing protein [Enterococcus malodoratus]SET17906.1 SIS domain-containing protein [Enterococcus malodoratus]
MTTMTMLDYINQEQETLTNILQTYDFSSDPSLAKMGTVTVLATGSSLNACLSAKIAFEKLADVNITIEEPYNFNHYGRLIKGTDTIIGVSQSGKSASTIDAMQNLHKSEIQRIVLTSDLTSPIAQVVDKVIDLNMGIETVGFVTKGFSATVMQLILLAIKVGVSKNQIDEQRLAELKQELLEIISSIQSVIDKSNVFFDHHENLLKLGGRFVALGYGPNWGVAKEFETKFTETVRRPSQGFELEAYMHGPYLEADWEHTLFFIETPSVNQSRSQALADYMDSYVGKILKVTTEKSSDAAVLGLDVTISEMFSPLLLIIPFQLIAYRTATVKGIDLSKRIFDDFDSVLKSKI